MQNTNLVMPATFIASAFNAKDNADGRSYEARR
jgi:hypothetical protein